MSEEQLKAFLEAVTADAGLQEQLKTAKDVDAVVAIAKAAGFVISVDELKESQAEISDEELEGVAGAATTDDVGWLLKGGVSLAGAVLGSPLAIFGCRSWQKEG